ncbi:MAG: PqqD family protein [Planctomycetes bacterium]|nr:PqqD family protein [Planctomycetota bacterium]
MSKAPANLYELRPVQALGFETGADGLVSVLVPRFENRLLVKLLVPLLRRPTFRVRLDALGSFVWSQCDGRATVTEIAARACAEFGGDAGAMLERTGSFLAKLVRERAVRMLGGEPAGG